MLFYIICLLTLLMIEVKSDENKLKYINNNTDIEDPNYCDNNICIIKCCPIGWFVSTNNITMKGKCAKPKRPEIIEMIKFTPSVFLNKLNLTNKDLKSKIVFVLNNQVVNKTVYIKMSSPAINQHGSLTYVSEGSTEVNPKHKYCVDFALITNKLTNVRKAVLSYRVIEHSDPDAYTKQVFLAIGLLISSFFLLLTLLVHLLLPELRGGIVKIILMSYVTVVMIFFIIRATINIMILINTIGNRCLYLTPVLYYFMLGTFFWLNILSFDIWNYGGKLNPRNSLPFRRQLTFEEKKTFGWYCLYACGSPLIICVLLAIVDLYKLYSGNLKPPIFNCIPNNPDANMLYINLPIGLITIVNCILFFRTANYMWGVNTGIASVKNSKNNKSAQNRFFLYLKLSVIMGVSWLLELLPDMPLVPFIIGCSYNLFSGIIIYVTLTWNKQIYSNLDEKYIIRRKRNPRKCSVSDPSSCVTKIDSLDPNDEENAVDETLV